MTGRDQRRTRVRSWAGAALVMAALTAAPSRADEILSRGRTIYRERCILCHGAHGRGDGDAVYLLLAPPRDFRAGRFRFVSTWEHVPTDDDLLRTITRGLPGSQMPSYAMLPEPDRRALVAVVKSFVEVPWTVAPSRPPGADGTPGSGVVVVPPQPADARTNRARGEELFREACAPCHGAAGRGDGRNDLVTVEGHRIRPRDLTRGGFKGDASPAGLYRRIVLGIPGTPMPSNEWAYGDDAWYLTYYVLSLGPQGRRR
jgi:cytochrome c oxidase cbb3-type subunit I/II